MTRQTLSNFGSAFAVFLLIMGLTFAPVAVVLHHAGSVIAERAEHRAFAMEAPVSDLGQASP